MQLPPHKCTSSHTLSHTVIHSHTHTHTRARAHTHTYALTHLISYVPVWCASLLFLPLNTIQWTYITDTCSYNQIHIIYCMAEPMQKYYSASMINEKNKNIENSLGDHACFVFERTYIVALTASLARPICLFLFWSVSVYLYLISLSLSLCMSVCLSVCPSGLTFATSKSLKGGRSLSFSQSHGLKE